MATVDLATPPPVLGTVTDADVFWHTPDVPGDVRMSARKSLPGGARLIEFRRSSVGDLAWLWVCRQPPPPDEARYPAPLWVALDSAAGEGAVVAWERWAEFGAVFARVRIAWPLDAAPSPTTKRLLADARCRATGVEDRYVWPACVPGSVVHEWDACAAAGLLGPRRHRLRCTGCEATSEGAVDDTPRRPWSAGGVAPAVARFVAAKMNDLRAAGCLGTLPPDLATAVGFVAAAGEEG